MATFQRLLAHVKNRLVEMVDIAVERDPTVSDFEDREQEDADGLPPFTFDCKKVLVTRSKNCLTISVGWPQRHIQFILRHYRCLYHVIGGFDIDCYTIPGWIFCRLSPCK